MYTLGSFTTREKADEALDRLADAGFPRRELALTEGGSANAARDAIPTTETEGPGMAAALAGAIGAALAAGAAGAIMPFVGGALLLSEVLAGIGGAAAGAAAGRKVEGTYSKGVPVDDLYLYDDSLRRGHTLVLVSTPSEAARDQADRILSEAGAVTPDELRESWWSAIEATERAEYAAVGGELDHDRDDYRAGFEAALRMAFRGRDYADAQRDLIARFGDRARAAGFRHGYRRGQAHVQQALEVQSERRTGTG